MPQRCPVLHTCIILLTAWTQKKTRSENSTGLVPDYEYIEGFGWYHLHTIPATWADARLRCNVEGGALASLTTNEVINLVKNTISEYGLKHSVIVDAIATKPKGNFSSLDGKPLLDRFLKWDENEPNNAGNDEDCLAMTSSGKIADVSCNDVHPYICVKNEARAHKCDTTDKGFKMDPHTDSCYKFHPEAVPWRRAAMVCLAEHAHLAIINSYKESQILKDLFAGHPESTIKGVTHPNCASIGFMDWEEERVFLTVFGETLENAGYAKWAPGQPNDDVPEQFCGSMTRYGELNAIECIHANQPFICETAYD